MHSQKLSFINIDCSFKLHMRDIALWLDEVNLLNKKKKSIINLFFLIKIKKKKICDYTGSNKLHAKITCGIRYLINLIGNCIVNIINNTNSKIQIFTIFFSLFFLKIKLPKIAIFFFPFCSCFFCFGHSYLVFPYKISSL